MGFYESLRDSTVAPVVRKYGGPLVLRRVGAAIVDGSAGTSTPGIEVDYPGFCIIEEYSTREIDGTRIQRDDKKLFTVIDAVSVIPTLSDRISLKSELYTIQDIKPLAPGGTALAYVLQVRK